VVKFQLILSTKYSHLDSSSFHLHGQYKNQNNERAGKEVEVSSEIPIFITHGYSRDHRPDLKQSIVDLIVSSDGDIPIMMRGGSGNESDKAMFGKILVEYSQQIDFESIMIADSALSSANNLILIKDLKWISRVPLSIKKAKDLVKEVKSEDLKDSVSKGYRYSESKVTYGGIEQRWIVIESEERKNSDLKKIVNRIEKEAEKTDREINKIIKLEFEQSSLALAKIRGRSSRGSKSRKNLIVYTIGQREIRNNLQAGKSFVKNQVNKSTERPTLRWIFQCFQGIHCFKLDGLERISNLSEERCQILGFLPVACQQYYLVN
jgi:transposase